MLSMTLRDHIAFAVAVVICTASVSAAAGHLLRPQPKDRLLLWFALFAGMYGVRMFFKQTLATALGIGAPTGRWVEIGLNYFILIPALLFSEEMYGLGWRRSLRWVTIGISVFAVVAIVIDVAAGDPTRVPEPAVLMLALIAAVFVSGYLAGYQAPRLDEWRVLVAGLSVFTLFVLNEHAVAARLVPWQGQVEPVGFLVLLGCLGYIALTRVFAQGRQLVAVEQEMRSAREIQQSILPRHLPAIPNVQMAARYVPLAAVAGDFYDIVALKGNAIAVLIADVSGHGVPAALIASMVKVAFTAELRETDDPGVILERMNGTLCGMFERSGDVTAVCAVLRPETSTLAYAAAGHPPPLLIPAAAEEVVSLDLRGVVLGIIPGATYTTTTIAAGRGARLILYTDGVTETPDPHWDDLFGIERLRALAATKRDQSPSSFADEVMASLQRFAGGLAERHDDVTLLIVDVVG